MQVSGRSAEEPVAQSCLLPTQVAPASMPVTERKEHRRDSRRSHYSSNSSMGSHDSPSPDKQRRNGSPSKPSSPKHTPRGSASRALSDVSQSSHTGQAANHPVSRFMELLRCVAEEHERVLSHTSAALIAENLSLSNRLRRAQEVISRHNLGNDHLQLPLTPTSTLCKKVSERRERAATMTEATQQTAVAAAAAAACTAKSQQKEQRVQTSPVLPSLKEISAAEKMTETTAEGMEKVSESEPEALACSPEAVQKGDCGNRSSTLSRWHRAVDSVKKRGKTHSWTDATSSSSNNISFGSLTPATPPQNQLAPILTVPIPQGQAAAPAPPSDVPAVLPLASNGDSSALPPISAKQSGSAAHLVQSVVAPAARDFAAGTTPEAETPRSPASGDDVGPTCERGTRTTRSTSADAPGETHFPSESDGSRASSRNPQGSCNVARRESDRSRNSSQNPHRSSKEELPSLLTGMMRKAQKCNSLQGRRMSLSLRHFTALARKSDADKSSAHTNSGSSTASEGSEPGSPKSVERARVPARLGKRASTIGSLAQIDISHLRIAPSEVTQGRRKSIATLTAPAGTLTAPAELTRDEVYTERGITLLCCWQDLKVRSPQSSLYTSSCSNHRSSRSWLQSQHEHEELLQFQSPRSFWIRSADKLIVRPGSKLRISWDFVGMALILYDLVSIPMQIFEPPPNPFSEVMSMFSTVFWTVDIPFSFVTGFYREGVLVERLDHIARHYARTWLVFDVVVISIDWCLTIAGEVGNALATDSVGYMRFGKTLRFLRMLRLLRLLKVHGLLSELIDRVHSEFCLIMLGIARVIVSIMLINHLIACSWYGIGTMGESREDTWVYQNNLPDKELIYKYTTALHWSLTQFTPASMEVVPENALERAFAVCILVFAMVTFSSLVSSITNAMTQLRNLNSEQLEQTALLRRYLGENKVSVALMGRVWGCTQQVMDKSKRRIHEKDVAIMALLPSTLKGDLQEEVYSPILSTHPFFHQLLATCPAVIRRACQQAVGEVSTGVGQELFNAGDEGSRMFFMLSGTLLYTLEDKAGQHSSLITPGYFISEAALWIIWKHAGQLAATTHCELVAILQRSFFTAVNEHHQLLRYAKCFSKHFQDCPEKLTDVFSDQDVLSDLARQAIAGEEDHYSNDSNADMETPLRTSAGSFTDMLMGLVPPMPLTSRRHSVNSLLQKITPGRRTSDQEAMKQEGSELSQSDDECSDVDAADSASSPSRASSSPMPTGGEGSLSEPQQKGKGVFRRMFLSPSTTSNRSAKMQQVNPASIAEDAHLADLSNSDLQSERTPDCSVDNEGVNLAEAPGLKSAGEGSMKPVMHDAWN